MAARIAFTVSREAELIAESVVACCAPKPTQNVLVIISAVEFDKTLGFLSTCIAKRSYAFRQVVRRQRNSTFDGYAVVPACEVPRGRARRPSVQV